GLAFRTGHGSHHAWPDHAAAGARWPHCHKDGILDRRSKELAVTKAGTERLQRAKLWVEAQKEFEERFGARRAADLRGLQAKSFRALSKRAASGSARQRQQTRARALKV